MSRPLRSRKPFFADFSRALATALGVLLAGSAAAGEIDFDEIEPANGNCCYLTDEYEGVGVHFDTDDDGSIWDGMSGGDPGHWRLEGTRGQAFLGFNGKSYELTVHFDEPVVDFSLDAARGFGSSGAAELRVWGLRGGEIVERVVVPLGAVDQWVTATVLSEVDAVRWKVLGESGFRPYGVDYLRWDPATPPEPDPLEMEIDLVAHGESHRVPLQRQGMLPVIVYGNEKVPVQELDLASLVLGDTAQPQPQPQRSGPHPMDANDDGFMDMLLFFSTPDTGLAVGDEWLCLEGQTLAGDPLRGCMDVEVVEPAARALVGSRAR